MPCLIVQKMLIMLENTPIMFILCSHYYVVRSICGLASSQRCVWWALIPTYLAFLCEFRRTLWRIGSSQRETGEKLMSCCQPQTYLSYHSGVVWHDHTQTYFVVSFCFNSHANNSWCSCIPLMLPYVYMYMHVYNYVTGSVNTHHLASTAKITMIL